MDIKAERIKRGLTQKELSIVSGFHIRTIQKWEGQERQIRQESEIKLTEGLSNYDKKTN